MRVCIHRGTQEIGGTCVEIESQGQRIVLDVGLPLEADPDAPPSLYPIPGFHEPDESLLAVVISHPHQDHYGLAHHLPVNTPFLIGAAAERILCAAKLFSPAGLKLLNTRHLRDQEKIQLGPFTITPYLVDHSAYDSYAMLIEADGKKLFYTADFRAHGRKSKLTERLIANPPSDVQLLLMEGTCLRDEGKVHESEAELVPSFVTLYKITKGMPLVWCSSQNIDRIVSVYKACLLTNRQLIIDMYTAEILRATQNPRIPQAHWDNIRVFLPTSQKRAIIRAKEFALAKSYRDQRIYPEQLKEAAADSVMLFRPSMINDLIAADCLNRATLIVSIWKGYLQEKANQPVIQMTQDKRIPTWFVHTSGHAGVADLKRLRGSFAEAKATPVHLENPEKFAETFDNACLRSDGEWWEV